MSTSTLSKATDVAFSVPARSDVLVMAADRGLALDHVVATKTELDTVLMALSNYRFCLPANDSSWGSRRPLVYLATAIEMLVDLDASPQAKAVCDTLRVVHERMVAAERDGVMLRVASGGRYA